jgi:hypothetical protein
MNETERLIVIHGEKYRKLITSSLIWLAREEPKWNLEKKIDREEFIRNLISHAATA